MDVLLKDVEIPEGYEPTGEFRKPNDGEYMLWRDEAIKADNHRAKHLILRKIKKYRIPSLPEDWGKECEFSLDQKNWCQGKLTGYIKSREDVVNPWRMGSCHLL